MLLLVCFSVLETARCSYSIVLTESRIDPKLSHPRPWGSSAPVPPSAPLPKQESQAKDSILSSRLDFITVAQVRLVPWKKSSSVNRKGNVVVFLDNEISTECADLLC